MASIGTLAARLAFGRVEKDLSLMSNGEDNEPGENERIALLLHAADIAQAEGRQDEAFDLVNNDMTKKAISGLINTCYRTLGLKATVLFADQLMYLGFAQATLSGVSVGMEDMVIPAEKEKIINTNLVSMAPHMVYKNLPTGTTLPTDVVITRKLHRLGTARPARQGDADLAAIGGQPHGHPLGLSRAPQHHRQRAPGHALGGVAQHFGDGHEAFALQPRIPAGDRGLVERGGAEQGRFGLHGFGPGGDPGVISQHSAVIQHQHWHLAQRIVFRHLAVFIPGDVHVQLAVDFFLQQDNACLAAVRAGQ